MGEEVDFYDIGPPDTKIVNALREASPDLTDPELLASLVYQSVGVDLDFGLIGVDQKVAEERPIVLNHLRRIQEEAAMIANRDATGYDVEPWVLALEDIVLDAKQSSSIQGIASRVAEAIWLLSSITISPRRGRSPNDRRTKAVVSAVAHYAASTADFSFIEPRAEKVTGAAAPKLIETKSSTIVRSVLSIIGRELTDSQLITLMRNVREELCGLKGPTAGN